ncbi:MAG: hypothetical protein L0H96_11020 [Humibacillus sp.]|nr:hypothetical protein [Humibacillus sp.]MDN5777433.1 hypothetical protein [Humibacillus sp.]
MTSTSWVQSAHLVRSAGFGGSGARADAVVRQGAPAWVQQSLRADSGDDPGSTATPVPAFEARPRVSAAGPTSGQ